MFNFEDYKRQIKRYPKLSNIRVVKDEAQHHEIIGYMYISCYKIIVSVTCDCYGSYAFVRPVFCVGDKDVNYIGDKVYYEVERELFNGLANCYHMKYNGIFTFGGIWTENVEAYGFRYDDLKMTDNLTETSLAFRCLDEAIKWINNPNLRGPLAKYCEYFDKKKALYALKH